MIPKVASHILQHTSRAAAAVQAQTTQSIRNAIQYQSSTPGSSSSGWGSTGGAKHNAGSKFYGHTQTNVDGHLVNQTNSASSHGAGASDDLDDYKKRITVLTRQPVFSTASSAQTRARSTSHSSGLSINRNIGVLEAIKKYARYKHSLAIEAAPVASPTPERVFTRRNSTSSASVASDEPIAPVSEDPADLPSSELESIELEAERKRPSSPFPATDPDLALDFAALREANYDPILLQEFHYAVKNANVPRVEQLITEFHEQGAKSVHFYNIALRAAAVVRAVGQPIGPFVAVYNEMLSNGIQPNESTYKILISVFCDRDLEVHRALDGVHGRQKRRALLTAEPKGSLDAELLARLQKEQTIHFQSASELFNLMAPRFSDISIQVYMGLLRSCSLHRDVDQAIKVYAHLEKFHRSKLIAPTVYYYLIQVYKGSKDVQGAQEVFNEFKEAARKGRIFWAQDNGSRTLAAMKAHIRVYNQMLAVYMGAEQSVKAVGLLEQMMDQNGGLEATPAEVPPPNARSFFELILGFIEQGDIESALSWHDRLVQQENKAFDDQEAPILAPTRPSVSQWEIVIEACAQAGIQYIDRLNLLWTSFLKAAEVDQFGVRGIFKHMVLEANLRAVATLEPTHPRMHTLLDFIMKDIVAVPSLLPNTFLVTGSVPMQDAFTMLAQQLSRAHRFSDAISAAQWMVESEIQTAKICEAHGTISSDVLNIHSKTIRLFIQNFTEDLLKVCGDNMQLCDAVALGFLRHSASMASRRDLMIATLRAFAIDRAMGVNTPLNAREWDVVLDSAAAFVNWDSLPEEVKRELPAPDIERMLHELRDQNIDTRALYSRKRLITSLATELGVPRTKELIDGLGECTANDVFSLLLSRYVNNVELKKNLESSTTPVIQHSSSADVIIDQFHSRIVEEYYPSHRTLTPLDGYRRFEQGVMNNIYPSPEAIARLIGALGRLGHLDKVRKLYNAAQAVLASLETKDKQWQSAGWYAVEDAMIVAFAHAGDITAAHVHRQRILQYRGVPSADAYGALISTTKDTTDDVASALAMWDESQTLGVRPHIFLYNTIISKLAKARKVDYALSLFQKMKQQGIRPSSVTFGAMISACARVGDTISAEHLFQEMASMNNYKPRIPPFNTMMQMYTYTKPDRARVLHYYEQLLATNIPPNGHTYKVLMDAYSTIEPVDFKAMESVFNTLCIDKKVTVVGSHWASLINAYGCVARDLDRAIEVFDRVAVHPSSLRSTQPMPDAVVYEAIINVLVTLHRIDLVPQYMERLAQSGVHMTAYIANLLIKGHAAIGNIDAARTTFEALVDPPEGVAAPNNHVPHGASEHRPLPSPDSPVYREPSTWEAMVRAELGYGEPARVDQLLQRMESRRYPPGVINRIRGILSNDTAPELGTPINQAYQYGTRIPGLGLYPASDSSTPPPI